MKKVIIMTLAFLLLNCTWAKNLAERIPKVDTATFCIKKVGGDSLELKIKRNIEIALPFEDLEMISTNDEKWHFQIFGQNIYKVSFPDDVDCDTFLHPMMVWSIVEVQEYFKGKASLAHDVKIYCNIDEKKIDGRVFDGEYFFEIRRYSAIRLLEAYDYTYSKKFMFKVDGRCSDDVSSRKSTERR